MENERDLVRNFRQGDYETDILGSRNIMSHAVFILNPVHSRHYVPSLNFTPNLQSAFYTDPYTYIKKRCDSNNLTCHAKDFLEVLS